MTRIRVRRLCAVGFSLHLCAALSYAGAIDLNDFVATGDVTVAADGSTATLVIDGFMNPELTNDGSPPVIVAAPDMSLEFDYAYVYVEPNLGGLTATLFDVDLGIGVGTLEQIHAGLFSEAGSVSWDLGGFVGMNLGLSFRLDTFDPGLPFAGSHAILSNLAIAGTTPTVPVPPTVGLVIVGSLALVFSRRQSLSPILRLKRPR